MHSQGLFSSYRQMYPFPGKLQNTLDSPFFIRTDSQRIVGLSDIVIVVLDIIPAIVRLGIHASL